MWTREIPGDDRWSGVEWDGMGFGEEGGAVGLGLFGSRPVGAADDGWVWWNGRNSGVERRAGLGLLMGLALKRYGLVGWVVRSEMALGGELFAKEEPIRGCIFWRQWR